ncbi:NAD-dependent dihydrogenase, Gfo/Idh/MocA family [Zea mays]|uniref:NAD-dependent dihydrogenase, Gfo/Idh/MocA family n=1 Tax=Zea mays TaxID=4577 RepID=A0A1D6EKK6_MAIZE|nr:NAD-dependent dihydrogenase, Gfo/Idh/MocA family [Zea mays]
MAGDGNGRAELPRIAVIGAGIFARTQYIPRLREIAHLVVLKSIWSRTQESAKAAAELARDFAPDIECKWGDAGLEEIMGDSSIMGVAIVLAGQVQVELSLKMLKAGKHVIQATTEAETALSIYHSFQNLFPHKPIWAVGENYRFEPAFIESSKLINDIGDMMHIQVIIEGSMNSSNPYFNSTWRRNFVGGFILDMGVHFIAGLRMVTSSCYISKSPFFSQKTQEIWASLRRIEGVRTQQHLHHTPKHNALTQHTLQQP